MRILVYEHVTACDNDALPASLRAEGAAMLAAATADFAACPDVEVVTRWDEEFDAALIVAPETGGVLTNLVEQIERRGMVRLLSPASSFCRWATDKTQVAATMIAAGVPMPRGMLLQPGDSLPESFSYPAVLKPNDGCGSQGITLLPPGEGGRRPDEGAWPDAGLNPQRTGIEVVTPASSQLPSPDRCRDRPLPVGEAERYRLEEFVPGMPVSVALLRGPRGGFPLPACRQHLSDDGAFTYRGGACPLPPAFAERAKSLAERAAAAMPVGYGYVGLDLVLGPADDGSQDYLIEINPRLTTSYIGLRALSETNLAAAMLDVIAGRVPQLAFRNRGVSFDSDGSVRYV